MEISIKGIGLIGEATIKLHGLTVISGANNSAKSTVGKVLYSLIESTSRVSEKAEYEHQQSLLATYKEANDELDSFIDIPSTITNNKVPRFVYDNDPLTQKIHISPRDLYSPNKLRDLEQKLINKITSFSEHLELHLDALSQDISEPFADYLKDQIETYKNRILIGVDKRRENLDIDRYLDQKLTDTLNLEFDKEVQHLAHPEQIAEIQVTDDYAFPPYLIQNNTVTHDANAPCYHSKRDKVYFIDTAYLLDDIRNLGDEQNEEDYKIRTHKKHLIHTLSRIVSDPSYVSTYEKTRIQDATKPTFEKINNVIPGSFHFASGSLRYKDERTNISARNLATGFKMFSLIKILLMAGEINENTQLILDEPEAHLHPAWQNKFAEIIVILVKELGVNVLLTTHSPNFMLALDAMMREYEIEELCHFYQTEIKEDTGSVVYHIHDDDMEQLYDELLTPYIQMKAKRNKHI